MGQRDIRCEAAGRWRMRLTEAQSRELLAKYGVFVTEVCDRCGKILGHVRFARYGEPGEWCSRLCRDGIEHKAGACRTCGASLSGKRKGSLFCNSTCRMRVRVRQNIAQTPIQNMGLAGAISASRCGDSLERQSARKSPLMAFCGKG